MSRVLVIESSARQRGSVSRLLTAEFISHWKAAHPADRFQVRDLAREPLPHLDELLLGAWTTPCDGHSAAERRALERSNRLTEELRIADVLVLAAPMYNFAIPSSLKSWFDHVLRAGLTFRYAEQGPEGLLQGKRAFVLTARGGIYAGGGLDHQEPYLRQVLGFVGIHDVTFIHAEGMNMGPEFRERPGASPRADAAGAGNEHFPLRPSANAPVIGRSTRSNPFPACSTGFLFRDGSRPRVPERRQSGRGFRAGVVASTRVNGARGRGDCCKEDGGPCPQNAVGGPCIAPPASPVRMFSRCVRPADVRSVRSRLPLWWRLN